MSAQHCWWLDGLNNMDSTHLFADDELDLDVPLTLSELRQTRCLLNEFTPSRIPNDAKINSLVVLLQKLSRHTDGATDSTSVNDGDGFPPNLTESVLVEAVPVQDDNRNARQSLDEASVDDGDRSLAINDGDNRAYQSLPELPSMEDNYGSVDRSILEVDVTDRARSLTESEPTNGVSMNSGKRSVERSLANAAPLEKADSVKEMATENNRDDNTEEASRIQTTHHSDNESADGDTINGIFCPAENIPIYILARFFELFSFCSTDPSNPTRTRLQASDASAKTTQSL